MKIAGIEIPKRLEFGNEDHIRIARAVEKRLTLIKEGMKCPWCNSKVYGKVIESRERIRWLCNSCGDESETNLDGE